MLKRTLENSDFPSGPRLLSPLSIDLGVQGCTGQREGVTGSLHLKLKF
jgi:hypothetical protein